MRQKYLGSFISTFPGLHVLRRCLRPSVAVPGFVTCKGAADRNGRSFVKAYPDLLVFLLAAQPELSVVTRVVGDFVTV